VAGGLPAVEEVGWAGVGVAVIVSVPFGSGWSPQVRRAGAAVAGGWPAPGVPGFWWSVRRDG
jgi:hypothetical protein